MKPARLTPSAKADLSDQAVHYAVKGGVALGEGWVREALAALRIVELQPAIGSPRWAAAGPEPGLRAWRPKRFPAAWFYFERADHLDVVRLLGDRQDIAAILAAGPE